MNWWSCSFSGGMDNKQNIQYISIKDFEELFHYFPLNQNHYKWLKEKQTEKKHMNRHRYGRATATEAVLFSTMTF